MLTLLKTKKELLKMKIGMLLEAAIITLCVVIINTIKLGMAAISLTSIMPIFCIALLFVLIYAFMDTIFTPKQKSIIFATIFAIICLTVTIFTGVFDIGWFAMIFVGLFLL